MHHRATDVAQQRMSEKERNEELYIQPAVVPREVTMATAERLARYT